MAFGLFAGLILAASALVVLPQLRSKDHPPVEGHRTAPGRLSPSTDSTAPRPDALSQPRSPWRSEAQRPASPGASSAPPRDPPGDIRQPIDERPIPGFKPEPGSVDPGPGPYMDLYQGRSGQLSSYASPKAIDPTTQVSSRGGEPVVLAWVPSIRVQAGQDALIQAVVIDHEQKLVVPDSVAINIARAGDTKGAALNLPMQPAPPGAHHQFEYRFPTVDITPEEGARTPVTVNYAIEASGTFNGEHYDHVAFGSFNVQFPGAKNDPASATVQKHDGDITVSFRAQVDTPGTYWGYAELWGGEDGAKPVAFARERWENVARGEPTFTLTFGGLIIRDSKVDGPYIVRNVRFMQVDSFPPQENDPIPELPPTPAWHAADFF